MSPKRDLQGTFGKIFKPIYNIDYKLKLMEQGWMALARYRREAVCEFYKFI
jgi:hypothetical protein